MRYWFDTEFHDFGTTIHLISIGVVAEDGREYYAVNADYDQGLADDWLNTNVLARLGSVAPKPALAIRSDLHRFFTSTTKPEFWADFGEYDWIVLRQLFGKMLDWPSGWPFLAMDVEQWRLQLGAPSYPSILHGTHNALDDARVCKARYDWLLDFALLRKAG